MDDAQEPQNKDCVEINNLSVRKPYRGIHPNLAGLVRRCYCAVTTGVTHLPINLATVGQQSDKLQQSF